MSRFNVWRIEEQVKMVACPRNQQYQGLSSTSPLSPFCCVRLVSGFALALRHKKGGHIFEGVLELMPAVVFILSFPTFDPLLDVCG